MIDVEKLATILKLLEQPRYADAKCLTRFGRRVFSQNDEDGIIAEIFARIGEKNKTFVEFGVEKGLECNSLWLLMQGWTGLWIEQDFDYCSAIQQTHSHWIRSKKLFLENENISANNINKIILKYFHQDIDFLSIDIDYNDFWIWKAIHAVKPRVVAIEYNASWPPPASITVPYDPDRTWDGSNYFGSSLVALTKLAKEKGYQLVGCSLTGVNAFFVREDLVENRFYFPGSATTHYEPPRYRLFDLNDGHRSGVGPVETV